tara:strand:+ start:368 stop:619 length:252 start_codon:yes stop_codon:yes gene_type:complete
MTKESYYQRNREKIKLYNSERRKTNSKVIEDEQLRYKKTRDLQILRAKIRSKKGIISYGLLSAKKKLEVEKLLKKEFKLTVLP